MLVCEINISDENKPVFFKLICDGKTIINIWEEKPTDSDPLADGGYDANSIIWGIYGFAMATYCDHELFYPNEVGRSWPDFIKDENNHLASHPLFEPICTYGCCGATDCGIYFEKNRIKLVTQMMRLYTSSVESVHINEEIYYASPEEYADLLIKFLIELSRLNTPPDQKSWGINHNYSFLYFLLEKAALEGREIIRKPLLRKLVEYKAQRMGKLGG